MRERGPLDMVPAVKRRRFENRADLSSFKYAKYNLYDFDYV